MLAAREALAAGVASKAAATVDVGRSLTAVARLLEETGKMDEAEAAYRRSESLLAVPAGSDPSAQGGAGVLSVAAGLPPVQHGPERRGAHGLQAGAVRPGGAGRGRRVHGRSPTRPGGHALSTSASSCRIQAKSGRRSPSSAQRLAINEKLAADHPAVTEFQSRRARNHNGLAILLEKTGRPGEAEAEYRAAIAIQEKLAADHPAVTEFHLRLADQPRQPQYPDERRGPARGGGGRATARRGRSRRRWPPTTPPSRNSARRLATSHNDLGILLLETGRPGEAEAEYRAAIAIHEKLAADHPAVTEFHYSLALSRDNLGQLLWQAGRRPEAEAECRAALAIIRKLADENPKDLDYQQVLAATLASLGKIRMGEARFAEALDSFRAACSIMERLPMLTTTHLYDLAMLPGADSRCGRRSAVRRAGRRGSGRG